MLVGWAARVRVSKAPRELLTCAMPLPTKDTFGFRASFHFPWINQTRFFRGTSKMRFRSLYLTIHRAFLDFRREAIAELTERATELLPELGRARRLILPQYGATRARLHLPVIRSLLYENGMGGGRWVNQFLEGFPR